MLDCRRRWNKYLGVLSTTIAANEEQSIWECILNLEHWRNVTPRNMESASHIIFRYRLLDILSQVLGMPRHEKWRPIPASNVKFMLSTRIEKVSTDDSCMFEILIWTQTAYKASQRLARVYITTQEVFWTQKTIAEGFIHCGWITSVPRHVPRNPPAKGWVIDSVAGYSVFTWCEVQQNHVKCYTPGVWHLLVQNG